MSSLIAIIHSDGSPAERETLGRAIEGSRRGPDASGIWTRGPVGLAHGLLDVSGDTSENQPSTLDGEVWITADARIDGRDTLIRELVSAGRISLPSRARLREAGADTLLLYAYATWGRSCVEKLIGDFAFAIWDGREKTLFCARDQLGVAPLFYTMADGRLIVASELDCLRSFPNVSTRLDDLAVADYLMFGQSQEPEATVFASVRRLPAAHTLSWSRGGLEVRRYWELRAPGVTETPSDPTGELEHLLQTAVDDRLRDTDSAGISMSGGIDSPLIAAMARGRHGGSRPVELLAETGVFDHLIPDDERRFAAIAANALDIPITFRPADEDYDRLVERLQAPSRLPEPPADPTAPVNEMLPSFATHTRVVLTGYDGDALCQIWLPSHFRRLIGRGRIGQAIQQIRELSRLTGSFPPKGATGFWSPYLLRQARRRAAAEFPQWIDAELVNGLDLVERWQQAQARGRPWSRAPEADAIELLTEGGARDVFENFDPAITGTGVAVRHPLFDLRVIEYMLALPPIPWKVEKTVLRRAASRSLPATLWQRPKSPLAADPLEIWISNATLQEREFQPSRAEAYVNSALLPTLSSASASGTLWPRLWATGLDRWLLGQGREA